MLKTLMMKRKIDDAKKTLETLRAKMSGFQEREAELEKDIAEAQTDEEKAGVEEAVDNFTAEKESAEAEEKTLREEIEKLESDLAEVEERAKAAQQSKPQGKKSEERKDMKIMNRRNVFSSLSHEERTAMFETEKVKNFISEVRTAIKEKRALSNAGLLIPDNFLGLLRENVLKYSKLVNRVNLVRVSGTGRQTVMGTIPEAVWTEMCANLNELSLAFYQNEVDGWKVGGFIPVCNAVLEDSDIDLASTILDAIAQAIGYALDKAIIFGDGTRMPLGFFTRLAQTAQPSGYSSTARPWVDLHTSNVLAIAAASTGTDFFKAFILDSAAAKGAYSRGTKFWAMNETTYSAIMAEAVSINAAGAVVSGVDATMPIVGGDIVVLPFIPDNMIFGGYGDLYLLAERAGTKLESSEHVRFINDQTVFKGTARYDGTPAIAEGFVAIGIKGTTPSATGITFAADTANTTTPASSSTDQG